MKKFDKSQFFKVAAAFLALRLISFKFTGEYLQCNFFTLSPHVTEHEMWIEDDMGCWQKFTNISDFRDFLKKRTDIKKDRKYYKP